MRATFISKSSWELSQELLLSQPVQVPCLNQCLAPETAQAQTNSSPTSCTGSGVPDNSQPSHVYLLTTSSGRIQLGSFHREQPAMHIQDTPPPPSRQCGIAPGKMGNIPKTRLNVIARHGGDTPGNPQGGNTTRCSFQHGGDVLRVAFQWGHRTYLVSWVFYTSFIRIKH